MSKETTKLADVLNLLKNLPGDDWRCKNLVLIGSRAMESKMSSETDWDFLGTPSTIVTFLKEARPPTVNLVRRISKSNPRLEHVTITGTRPILFDITVVTSENCAIPTDYKIVSHLHADQKVKMIDIFPKMKSRAILCPLNICEVIKTSHIYFPHHFTKHIVQLGHLRDRVFDHHMTKQYVDRTPFLKRSDQLETWLKNRRQEYEQAFGVPGEQINLNKTNEEFLDETKLMERNFIKHDDLHELLKIGETPAQDLYRPDLKMAKCDRKMFDALPFETRMNGVNEECMVIAVERYLLAGEKSAQYAFEQACMRVATSLTKGWFREFVVNNFSQIRSVHDISAVANQILFKAEEQRRKQVEEKIRQDREDQFVELETNYGLQLSGAEKDMFLTMSLVEQENGQGDGVDWIYYRYQIPTDDSENYVSAFIIHIRNIRAGGDCDPTTQWRSLIMVVSTEDLHDWSSIKYETKESWGTDWKPIAPDAQYFSAGLEYYLNSDDLLGKYHSNCPENSVMFRFEASIAKGWGSGSSGSDCSIQTSVLSDSVSSSLAPYSLSLQDVTIPCLSTHLCRIVLEYAQDDIDSESFLKILLLKAQPTMELGAQKAIDQVTNGSEFHPWLELWKKGSFEHEDVSFSDPHEPEGRDDNSDDGYTSWY